MQVTLLLKVTKTNLVVAKLAAGGHKKDSKVGNSCIVSPLLCVSWTLKG